MRTFLVFALVCVLSSTAFAVTDSGSENGTPAIKTAGTDGTGDAGLTTQFASDNNFAGNSFDVVATQEVTIDGFDLNLDNSILPEFTIDVYYREGTANGFETSAAGWTLLGSEVVTAAGLDLPSHCNIGGLNIPAGTTIGFIITSEESVSGVGDFCYTNGGPNTYSDAYIDITTYRGLSDGFPPASTFAYRSWNGTVYYWFGDSLDRATWGSIKVGY